jgi:hypothetical protein
MSSTVYQLIIKQVNITRNILFIATGLWFSPGTPVSSTNKADTHEITEILLKVALNTIYHHLPIVEKILLLNKSQLMLVLHH